MVVRVKVLIEIMAKNQNGVVTEGDQCQCLFAVRERKDGLLNDVDGFPKIL